MHTGVAFLFLSVFSSAVHCAGAKWNLDTKITTVPAGSKFGLKMDYELAIETGGKDAAKASTFAKLFSSHVTFNKPVSTITDGEWAAMAIDAYWGDIILAKKQYGGLAEMQTFDPNVLVILSFGSEAYFSTSHKGASFAYNSPNSLVKEELAKCQKEFKDETGEDVCHKNNAQCGEVMAVQQYFVDKGKDLEKQKAKIIAVRRSQDKKTKAFLKPEVIDPCCTGSEVSCYKCPFSHLLRYFGFLTRSRILGAATSLSRSLL